MNAVSLAEARREAEKWRALAQKGMDPIKERERLKIEAAKEHPTLAMVMADAFEARKAELKADGKAGRWDSPLRVHVLPKLGDMPLKDLHQIDIRDTLAPIWHTKPEAAKKALDRLRIIVRYGAAMGLDVDLQAVEDKDVRAEGVEVEFTTGIMSFTPDGDPLCGRLPDVQGLYHCSGFCGHGIAQSGAVGLLMAELILDGKCRYDLERLRADRFFDLPELYGRPEIETRCYRTYADYYGAVELAAPA